MTLRHQRIVIEAWTNDLDRETYFYSTPDGLGSFVSYLGFVRGGIVSREEIPPPLPPEPPVGSVILDGDGEAYRRFRIGWFCADATTTMYDWAYVNSVQPVEILHEAEA